jgi:hypothetical protein
MRRKLLKIKRKTETPGPPIMPGGMTHVRVTKASANEGQRVLVAPADLQASVFKLARKLETMAGEFELSRPLASGHEAVKNGNCQ